MLPNNSPPRRTLEFRPAMSPRHADSAEREARSRLRSGVYSAVDEFVGLDRLDRDELDEDDRDVS